jgi:hypothetical protein
MVDDVDRSLDVAVEDLHGDKKPAASVSKIGASHGSLLEMISRIKKAKKELLFRDTSLSGSTVASAALETGRRILLRVLFKKVSEWQKRCE